MGLFDRFKKIVLDDPKPISSSHSSIDAPSISKDNLNYNTDIDGWISIQKPNFFGQYYRSNNEKFIVAWSNAKNVLLLKEGKLHFIDYFKRPENGAVSDDGTFIFNDWTFNNNHGIFYAFNENGTPLLKRNFNLNLLNNGISDNGHYAVCQAANSDHEDDGGKLFFFDLKNKRILWKKHMETGWANWYKFDTEKEILYLSYSEGHEYRYTFKGEFIDSDKYIKDRLNSDIGYEFLNAIKEIREQIENDNSSYNYDDVIIMPIKEIREQIENVNSSYNYDDVIIMLGKGAKRFKDPDTRARIHRNFGEIYYTKGLVTEAISHLQQAYELNPKVGVKRLLNKLKKETNTID